MRNRLRQLRHWQEAGKSDACFVEDKLRLLALPYRYRSVHRLIRRLLDLLRQQMRKQSRLLNWQRNNKQIRPMTQRPAGLDESVAEILTGFGLA
jgi:Arc/MetJ family transcription regulator